VLKRARCKEGGETGNVGEAGDAEEAGGAGEGGEAGDEREVAEARKEPERVEPRERAEPRERNGREGMLRLRTRSRPRRLFDANRKPNRSSRGPR